MVEVYYASENSCGVAAKNFYNSVGSNILAVSQGTGISRSALSRIVVHKAKKQTADIALEYLENEIQVKYIEHVEALQKELDDEWTRYVEHVKALQKKAESEWTQYLARDDVLQKCRAEYGLERKYPRAGKIEIDKEILNKKKGQ